MMNDLTLSVSELNAYIKNKFDSDLTLRNVVVSGEISNFSVHRASGHFYFSLKDEHASIKAVMFRSSNSRLRFLPENGMKVIAVGRVSVFERDGAYQLYAEEMIPDGAGALSIAFEQLKNKLSAEGLFDEKHKRALPAFPRRIGVITSPEGAVRRDIENVTARRYPFCELLIYGVTVQGNAAAGEITEAIRWFNRKKNADVLIVARGGGSMEDLWCFNDEGLARAVFASEIPVISAVGHETDFTICDFVADRRAPTPSAAAEIATPDVTDLKRKLSAAANALIQTYRREIGEKRAVFSVLSAKRDFSNVGAFFDGERRHTEELKNRLDLRISDLLADERIRFDRDFDKLVKGIGDKINREKLRFTEDVTALKKLNPLDVLLRGYAAIEMNGQIKSSVKGMAVGEKITAVLADGALYCMITDIKEEKTYGKHEI